MTSNAIQVGRLVDVYEGGSWDRQVGIVSELSHFDARVLFPTGEHVWFLLEALT